MPISIISYLIAGYDIVIRCFRNIIKGQLLDENFLMTLATIGAFVIGTNDLLGMEAPGADRLERGFQNCVCWHEYPHGRASSPKCVLPASMLLEGIPIASCPAGRLSKINNWI